MYIVIYLWRSCQEKLMTMTQAAYLFKLLKSYAIKLDNINHYISTQSIYLKRRKYKKTVNTKVSGNLHFHYLDIYKKKSYIYHSLYSVLSLVSLMRCFLFRAIARYKLFTKTILPMIKLTQNMVNMNYFLTIFWWRRSMFS